MAGAVLEIKSKELATLNKRLVKWFAKIDKPSEAMELIATHLESQTRRRIEEERADSESRAWPEWSEKYAKTRHENQNLLQNEGDLVDDIAPDSGADFAKAYVTMIYARTHQLGDKKRNIPARPYLGLSKVNAKDIENEIAKFIEAAL